jgi:D-alanine-D-alanine ligase
MSVPEKILILHVRREQTPNYEFISDQQISLMSKALSSHGWCCSEAKYHPTSVAQTLAQQCPDIVFNLVYGFSDGRAVAPERQDESARQIEQAGVMMVGSDATALALALDKKAIGSYLARFGVRTPRILEPSCLGNGEIAVTKPRFGGCHRGVKVIRGAEQAMNYLQGVAEEFVFQEYVVGREFTVSVIEKEHQLSALPPIEVIFERMTENKACIMAWNDFKFDFSVADQDSFHLREFALCVFEKLKFRDYGRFDIRVDVDGPVLLDANALPNLDPKMSLLPMSARAAGIQYDELIALLADSARRRLAMLG